MNDFFYYLYSEMLGLWHLVGDANFCEYFKGGFELEQESDETVYAPCLYVFIGIVTMIVSLLSTIAYYYWPINHPRFIKWWSWLIMAVGNGILCFITGAGYASYKIKHISEEIIDAFRNESELSADFEGFADGCYWGFGLENFFISILFFALFSLLLNWGSSNAKYSPFKF